MTVQLIVFLPLLAAIVAGLGGRVIPAKAGTSEQEVAGGLPEAPAFAGVTMGAIPLIPSSG